MFGLIVAGLIAAAPLPAARPSPGPPRLRIITTVKSTEFCTAVREMAIPIGFINRRNDDAFQALVGNMRRALSPAGSDESNGSLPVSQQSVGNAMIATRETTYQVIQNLTSEDDLMNEEWARSPRGSDPNVDALRQRLQNMMDLQRSLANHFEQAGDAYTNCVGSRAVGFLDDQDNADVSNLDCSGGESVGAIKLGLRYGGAKALADLKTANDPEDLPEVSAHDIAHFGTPEDIADQLLLQEEAFVAEIVPAGKTCGI
jgi:hypothetical protein